MKKTKGLIGVILLFILVIPFSIKADFDDWGENGGAGESGSSASGSCNSYNDFCLFNVRGGSKGVRVSLAYCTSSGCTLETSLKTSRGNVSVKKHDYWLKIMAGNYNYYGITKTQKDSISRSNPNSNYTSNYSGNYSENSFFLIDSATSDHFFGNLEEIFKVDSVKKNNISSILSKMGISEDDLRDASNEKCKSCDFSKDSEQGYRIILEPIFWWKTNYGNTNWLLTPNEVLKITSSRKNMAGNNDYRLYTTGVGLHTTKDDIYYKKWNGDNSLSKSSFGQSNDSFRNDFKANYGIGINIINPLYDSKKMTCSMANAAIPGLDRASCDTVSKGDIFKNVFIDGKPIDKNWYYNECTCCGMTTVFDNLVKTNKDTYTSDINGLNKVFGTTDWYKKIQFSDVKTNRLSKILSYGVFNEYNTTWANYSATVNAQWTPVSYEKYMRVGCSGRQEDNYWCKELQDWYKQTIETNRLPYKPLTSLTKDEIIGPKYWEVTNILKAYNIVYNQANGFFWSANSEIDAPTPTFSYVKRCIEPQSPGLSCDSVKTFYSLRGQSLNNKSCDYISKFNFSAYNIANGTNVNSIWFQNNCGCNSTTVTNCTPEYNIGTCTSGENIYYKDSSNGTIDDKYWNNCVFNDNGSYDMDTHKTSSNGTNTYYDESLSNKYCKVYCVEELSTNFNGNININAGGHFDWSNHRVKGSRTCKTKNIDYDVFEDDVESANEDIENKYHDWKLEETTSKVIANATKSSNMNCDYSCKGVASSYGVPCCKSATRSCSNCYYGNPKSCVGGYDTVYINGKPKLKWNSCKSTRNTCSYGCSNYYCSSGQSLPEIPHGYTYTPVNSSWNGENTTVSSWCSSDGRPVTNVQAKKDLYTDAIKTGAATVSEMQSCYQKEDWRSNLYNFNPILSVKYDSPKYDYDGELEGNVNYGNVNANLSKCASTTIGLIKGCSGVNCPKTNVGMQKCSTVEMSRNASVSFDIPSDVYRYVIKDTNESLMTTDFNKLLNSYNIADKTLNYIDIGRGNFPVAYATPDGKYGVNSSNGGELSLDYKDLGHKQGSKKTMVDNIISTLAPLDYGKWTCNYYVNSYLINDKDVTVVYRPIDLTNPFPDLNGKGRNTGRNWCGPDGCSSKNNVVKDIITNNRGVKENEIYNKEPMYSFVLTPVIIKEIQKYNKENKYDNYIGHMGSTQTFDFVCDKGTARNCISDYLTNLIALTEATGTCTTDRKEKFESCRN